MVADLRHNNFYTTERKIGTVPVHFLKSCFFTFVLNCIYLNLNLCKTIFFSRKPEPAAWAGAGQDWTGSPTLTAGIWKARLRAELGRVGEAVCVQLWSVLTSSLAIQNGNFYLQSRAVDLHSLYADPDPDPQPCYKVILFCKLQRRDFAPTLAK